MLKVRGLTVTYKGAIRGLTDVSLTVEPGEIVSVLGANGAGKTTLLRAISGVLNRHGGAVEAGSMEFNGHSLDRMPTHRRVRSGLVQVPEGRRVFGSLTVEENLVLGGAARGAAHNAAMTRVMDLFPILADRRTQRAGLLSGGEQQMLAIARGLMAEPRLLVLDEPSLGLAPRVVDDIGQLIRTINEAGTSVLLVEQNTGMAMDVANRVFVLTLGEVTASGSAAELANSDEIRALYLGHSESRSAQAFASPAMGNASGSERR